MIRRPPRSTHCISSAASDVYKRQVRRHQIIPYKTNEKRRFCLGRVRRIGAPPTPSSRRCSCHAPHPNRLQFANWNARERRRCNTGGPMQNAIFKGYQLWLDVFYLFTQQHKCIVVRINSENELESICYSIDRNSTAGRRSGHAGRSTGRLHAKLQQNASE